MRPSTASKKAAMWHAYLKGKAERGVRGQVASSGSGCPGGIVTGTRIGGAGCVDVDVEEDERGMLKDAAEEMLDIGGKETDVDALDDA